MSTETAKEKREYNKWRKGQLAKHKFCVVFPFRAAREVHHIARGTHRKVALMEPCATAPVSRDGHLKMESWPLEKQLAVKMCASPEHAAEIDLPRFNELRGRDALAITLADLQPYLKVRK